VRAPLGAGCLAAACLAAACPAACCVAAGCLGAVLATGCITHVSRALLAILLALYPADRTNIRASTVTLMSGKFAHNRRCLRF
jgi:hypothetical protein